MRIQILILGFKGLKTQLMQFLQRESLKNQACRDFKPRCRCNALTNREKSLRHVAMVAKCLDDNKPTTSLKK